jgi:hypothetical protein
MPSPFAVADPIVEFFALRAAERTVRSYAPAQHARVRMHFDAAERRLAGGQSLAQAVPAALLLRDALSHYLLAIEVARGANVDTLVAGDLAAVLPTIPRDPALPEAVPGDDERVRAALAAADSLQFDRLSPEDVERTRSALERAAVRLRGRVEARTLSNVRGTRWGRLAALAVVIVYAILVSWRAAFAPPNIARGKPVYPSSLRVNPPDGHELVDGTVGTSYGVHTNTEESPNVVIDLQDVYRINRVNVHNRADGWFDDCLPLLVELSTDGKTYTELARREEHFDSDPPWVIDGRRQPARYVRLRVPRLSYIALSEVEVFGKKK